MVTKKEMKDKFKELKDLNQKKKDAKRDILSMCKKTLDKEINEINGDISKILGGQFKNIHEFQFSKEAQDLFTEYGNSNHTDYFVLLNPFYRDKKKKYDEGAFSGGQLGIRKYNNKWTLSKQTYMDQLLDDDPNLCNFEFMKTSKDINKCQKALMTDFEILEHIDKLAKKNPDEFTKLLEY